MLSLENYPQLDTTILFRLRNDLENEFPRFIAIFNDHSQQLLISVQESLKNNDLKQAKIALHSFKGMSASIGAVRLSQLCKHAEMLIDRAELIEKNDLITTLEYTLQELNHIIKQALED